MNCLRCGRTVAENTLLCADCLREREKPVRREPELTPEQTREKRFAAMSRSRRRLRGWLALFVVFALLASAAIAGGFFYVRRLQRQLSSQTSRINSLETVISEQQGQLEQANALNGILRDTIDRDQQTIDAYQSFTGLTPDEIAVRQESASAAGEAAADGAKKP